MPNELKDDRAFDFMANLSHGSAEALQQEINKTFGVVVKHELRETNVLILKLGKALGRGIKPSIGNQPTERFSEDTLTWLNYPLSILDVFLEDYFKTPIIDETGLTQNYDFALQWQGQWRFNSRHDPEGLKQIISDQLGLELVPTNMPIEMLVVEKVK